MTTPYQPPTTLGTSRTNQVKILTQNIASRKAANDAIAQASADLAAQRTATIQGPNTGSNNTGGTNGKS